MENFNRTNNDYSKALLRLKEALQIQRPDDLHIDGIIKRFEFTFDLAYQAIKEYFGFIRIDIFAIDGKELLKLAFEEKLIADKDIWIQMLETRTNIFDDYSYDKSKKIYLDIKNTYVDVLEKLYIKFSRGE